MYNDPSTFSAAAQSALSGLLSDVDAFDSLDAADITFTGQVPRFGTPHRIVAAQAAAIGAVAAGIAQRWQQSYGERQTVMIDALQAGCSLHPAHFQRQYGHPIQALSLARELKADFYHTADGRWFFPIGSYPHLRDGVLELLDCPNTPTALSKAVARWQAADLEEAFFRRGLPGAFARSQAEWAEHPQGQALLADPVITIEKIGESKPELPRPQRRPLDDLRVLDAAHVIAGPVVARTFAEHGADVLRVSSPMQPDPLPQIIDTGIGKRCSFIDLRQEGDAARLRELARSADVFVQSWRPSSLDKFGLGAADVARLRPGIVYVSVSAFGFHGPWATRKGFEQLGQTVSGLAVTEGGAGTPRMVPTYLLNDYMVAYLGAAGALAALARRAREGGSYHVKVSLTRASMWVQSLGLQSPPVDVQTLDHLQPVLYSRSSPFGLLEQLGPVAQFSRTPAYWALPPSPLGSHAPTWST